MTGRRVIAKNTIYNLLASAVSYPATIVMTIVMSRTLAPQNYGIWSLCLVYGSLSLRLATAGLLPGCATYMMKELSVGGEKSPLLFSNYIALEAALIFFGSIISVLCVGFFYSDAYLLSALKIAVLYNVILSLNSIFNYVYQAHDDMRSRFFMTILTVGVNLTNLVIWAIFFHGVRSLLVMSSCVYLFICTTQFFYVQKKYRLWKPVTIKIKHWFGFIKKSFFFAVNSQLLPLFLSVDVLMLSWLSTTVEIGLYRISFTYLTIAAALPAAMGWALFPMLTRLQRNGTGNVEAVRHYFPVVKVHLCLGILISLGYFSFADIFIPFFYGEDYQMSATLLKVLSVSVFLSFISASFAGYLNTGNREKLSSLALGMGVVLNILLNIILIPTHGAMGAAIATVASELLLCVVYGYVFSREIISWREGWMKLTLVSGAFMLLLGWIVVFVAKVSIILGFLVAMAGSPLIILVSKIYPQESVSIFKSFLIEIKGLLRLSR